MRKKKSLEGCKSTYHQRRGGELPCEREKGHKGKHMYYHCELLWWNNKGTLTRE